MRAVAQVDADQLLAAAALHEVLRRPEQRRGRWRERQDPGDGLELLAGLAIEGVDAVGVGLDEGLAAGGRRARIL